MFAHEIEDTREGTQEARGLHTRILHFTLNNWYQSEKSRVCKKAPFHRRAGVESGHEAARVLKERDLGRS